MAIALPASYILLYLLPQSGELPERDYWWVLANIYSLDGLSPHWEDWFTRNNEHLLFIPSVIYALNLYLTQGSNLGLCLATFGVAAIQGLLLMALLPAAVRRDRRPYGLLIFCIAVFSFTPAAAHNWMRGFSGAIWMTANGFVVAAIFCFQQVLKHQGYALPMSDQAPPPVGASDEIYLSGIGGDAPNGRETNPTVSDADLTVADWDKRDADSTTREKSPGSVWSWVLLSLIGGGLAALSYSSSLALWPILALSVMVLRCRWVLRVIYLGAAIAVLGLYFLTYQRPAHHPDLASPGSLQTLSYIPRYLGWIFSDQPAVAILLGTIGLGLCFVLVGYWLITDGQRQSPEWYPWLAIQGYILGTAAMAAVSRSGFGLEQAQTSRYGSLPALFWLATIVLGVTVLQTRLSPPWRSRLGLALLALVLVLIGNMYRIGIEIAETIALRAAHQPLVALSLQLGVQDPTIARAIVGNRPTAFFHLTPVLMAHQRVPFAQDIRQHNACVAIGQPLPLLSSQAAAIGAITHQEVLADQVVTLEGWIAAPRRQIRCLALVDRAHLVQGFGLPGLQRAENVIQVQGSSPAVLGWKGYAHLPTSSSQSLDFEVYVAFYNQPGWVALRNQSQ